MSTKRNTDKRRKRTRSKTSMYVLIFIECVLIIALIAGGVYLARTFGSNDPTDPTDPTGTVPSNPSVPSDPTTGTSVPTDPTDPPPQRKTGYIATLGLHADYYDAEGTVLGTLPRGTQVEYALYHDGTIKLLIDGAEAYLGEDASLVADLAEIIPAHRLYVRTAVNLRDIDGNVLATLAAKGDAVDVTGYDYLLDDGTVHMYKVSYSDQEGYIMPWYLVDTEEAAIENYNGNDKYSIHENRGDLYGGGGAANLDFFPRDKDFIPNTLMPEECRTLYVVSWRLHEIDDYLEIANNSGINAFVVNILDGSSVGYASDVMNKYCPSAKSSANNSVEGYKAAIKKIKDAGYYVIGRITAFNDYFFVKDHPECAITDNNGDPLKINGAYWPTPYNRTSWQYKVELAVEAAELMGFDEIQFDYVRFPDLTWKYEQNGTIDYHNTYGETKAQAIQRFLMYATDILHEHGVYVGADVYGESAYTYVTAYGQYWAAISNVVDVISGMPYPDHFSPSGSWLPWEHPYDTLYSWGRSVVARQKETATPAIVRTWIQAYNAIRKPYNTYGPEEVAAEIQALLDAGCTGGYMTWHGNSSLDKYASLMPAFAPSKKE